MVDEVGVREGYKMTEVGVVPEDWEVKELNELIYDNPQYGINAAAVEYMDNLPTYLRITDISVSGRFIKSKKAYVDNINSMNYCLSDNDIVFARTGASTGKTYLYNPNDGVLVFAGFLIKISINNKLLNPKFLKAYTETQTYWNWVKVMSMRSGQPGINSNEYSQMKLPLPPLEEQDLIAQALTDTDNLIHSIEKVIDKKEKIKQGTMQELLTGKKRLDGFGGEWGVKKIGEMAIVSTGSKNTQDKIESGEYPFYVRSSTVEKIDSYSYNGEAILTAGDGVGTGKVFHYINGKFDLHQRVYKISDFHKDLYGYFFYLYFSNNFFERVMAMTAKSSVDSVRREMISDMPIPVPPLEEQKIISKILSDMDQEIESLNHELEKYKTIKQGMMQELLTGGIRLI